MTDEVKLRLYVTAIVIVMAILYVSPPFGFAERTVGVSSNI